MYEKDKIKPINQAILSIIIPVYNGEKYLSDAICSILKQPCQDYEIIVVDDGSTDNSLAIAKRLMYENECINVIHTENGGVSQARNIGIENAKGDYIVFLDADDVLCKNAYNENIHNILQRNEHSLISLSYINGSENFSYGNYYDSCDAVYIIDKKKLDLDVFKHVSSFIYQRKLFDVNETIRFPEKVRIREDVTFLYLVIQNIHSLRCMNHKWFIYRNNSVSVLHQLDNYEFIVNDVVPAWSICKQKCEGQEGKNGCDAWIFAEMVEYIILSCRDGVPLKNIQKALDIPEFKESLDNYDVLWEAKKQRYQEFKAHPRLFWLKNRTCGIPYNLVRKMVKIPLIRKQYFMMKYEHDISSYL